MNEGNNKGATMIEFLLALPFLLRLFLFMIDASFVLYKYLRLNHAATELTRRLSTNLGEQFEIRSGTTIQCGDIVNWSNQVIAQYRSDRSAIVGDMSLNLESIRASVPPYPLISVAATWSGSCITCAFFHSGPGTSLQTRSVLVIENNNPIDCSSCGGLVNCVP